MHNLIRNPRKTLSELHQSLKLLDTIDHKTFFTTHALMYGDIQKIIELLQTVNKIIPISDNNICKGNQLLLNCQKVIESQ
jgi:hypothetical protein